MPAFTSFDGAKADVKCIVFERPVMRAGTIGGEGFVCIMHGTTAGLSLLIEPVPSKRED